MKNIVQGSLITTFRCNAKCNMCNIWKFPTKPDEEIDAEYYKKLPAGLRINITGDCFQTMDAPNPSSMRFCTTKKHPASNSGEKYLL